LVVVDVTDAGGFGEVFIFALNTRLGFYEVIWDGVGYAPRYGVSPTKVTNITNGFRFSFTRAGGWPDGDLVVVVEAVNAAGGATRSEFPSR
jgi:hypothetical protein